MVGTTQMVYLTQLVYVHAGREAEFEQFEAIVLPLLAKYHGQLVLRLRPDEASLIAGTEERPFELHVVSFESEDDFVRYSNDDERRRVMHLKDRSVERTVVIKGSRV
jgi:hypothetical protein